MEYLTKDIIIDESHLDTHNNLVCVPNQVWRDTVHVTCVTPVSIERPMYDFSTLIICITLIIICKLAFDIIYKSKKLYVDSKLVDRVFEDEVDRYDI